MTSVAELSPLQTPPTERPETPPRATRKPRQPADPYTQIYTDYCSGCHGSTLSGGRAPTLFDDTWRGGGDDASLTTSIREGLRGTEMPPFKEVLTEAQIEGLIGYLRRQRLLVEKNASRARHPAGQVVRSEQQTFKLEVVAEGLATPWGMAFLPDGRLLVTERPGGLRVIEKGKLLPTPIADTPTVWTEQDGGLFDIEAHPDYAENGWLYLSYAEPGKQATSMTTIVRGRIQNGHWVDQEVLYRAPADLFFPTNVHYGSRFLFDKQGHLFYTIGDRGHDTDAQDLSRSNGKVHRVNGDGTVPRDNPFVGRAGALESIWSYGHRNPQGLSRHPVTGELWAAEHGPIGGDELNRIEPGRNYGWPLVTFGRMGRNAQPIPTEQRGMEAPVTHWNPTIAPSGIAFYTGDRFPAWKNDLFVTGLGGEALRRLEIDGDKVLHEEVVFTEFGRVRDVSTGPDGYLYVALAVPGVRVSDTTPGMIVRLVPAGDE
ncbi:MAG: glucose sorbosone dehydrogenase [Luteitalea sp.]|nr:glucose sorbosone dehydrogenase [Luteitalea sp.]